MDPLTLGLIIGGVWLFTRKPGNVVATIPSSSSSSAGAGFTPGTPGASPLTYTGAIPSPRAVEDTSASPIEQSGYIPPYVPQAGPSAVALALDWGRGNPGATPVDGLGCPCGGSCGGLGDPGRPDRARAIRRRSQGLGAQLRALRDGSRLQILAARQAGNWGLVQTLIDDERDRADELVRSYQAANQDLFPRLAKSVAPQFLRR